MVGVRIGSWRVTGTTQAVGGMVQSVGVLQGGRRPSEPGLGLPRVLYANVFPGTRAARQRGAGTPAQVLQPAPQPPAGCAAGADRRAGAGVAAGAGGGVC